MGDVCVTCWLCKQNELIFSVQQKRFSELRAVCPNKLAFSVRHVLFWVITFFFFYWRKSLKNCFPTSTVKWMMYHMADYYRVVLVSCSLEEGSPIDSFLQRSIQGLWTQQQCRNRSTDKYSLSSACSSTSAALFHWKGILSRPFFLKEGLLPIPVFTPAY